MQYHIPVLTNEVLGLLDPAKDDVVVDCTLGTGGHSEAVLKKSGGTGKVIGIDADERNLAIAKNRLKNYHNITFIHDNFSHLPSLIPNPSSLTPYHFLFDLGLSSLHVDDPLRGFSFLHPGPIDMRFDASCGVTAAEIVNTYSPEDLISLLKTYGQERFAARIVKEIVNYRRSRKFTDTVELADCIARAVGNYRGQRKRPIHPATRVFQALRIAANREIEALSEGLNGALALSRTGSRIVVISYHSLEDRIVKNFFRSHAKDGALKLLTKKPITPSSQEINLNRRARSAKLRAAEKL